MMYIVKIFDEIGVEVAGFSLHLPDYPENRTFEFTLPGDSGVKEVFRGMMWREVKHAPATAEAA